MLWPILYRGHKYSAFCIQFKLGVSPSMQMKNPFLKQVRSGIFHCMDCLFVSSSKWWTQRSSRLGSVRRNQMVLRQIIFSTISGDILLALASLFIISRLTSIIMWWTRSMFPRCWQLQDVQILGHVQDSAFPAKSQLCLLLVLFVLLVFLMVFAVSLFDLSRMPVDG